MSTIDEIQQLSDGKFHSLGDDLLRRLEQRYRRLRTHGLNARGESIKGQPDSYVGDTAATASIAVCYTVQRASWWNKVIADVRAAVVASHLATNTSETVRMLALLGRFGQQADHELAAAYVNHADDLVANVACEVMLRLSDPLLIPNRWRTI